MNTNNNKSESTLFDSLFGLYGLYVIAFTFYTLVTVWVIQ